MVSRCPPHDTGAGDIGGTPVTEGFTYASDRNTETLSVEQMRDLLELANV